MVEQRKGYAMIREAGPRVGEAKSCGAMHRVAMAQQSEAMRGYAKASRGAARLSTQWQRDGGRRYAPRRIPAAGTEVGIRASPPRRLFQLHERVVVDAGATIRSAINERERI